MRRAILLAAVAVELNLAAVAPLEQVPSFYVWRKVAPCQDTRQDWFTVSESYPGGLQYWFQEAGPFPTFAGAMAVADGLKRGPKFVDACCPDWGVFRDTRTGTFTAARTAEPLPPEYVLQRGWLCCEQAFWRAGLPVGANRDCRNLQLADGTSVTVQADGESWLTTVGGVPVPPPFTGQASPSPLPTDVLPPELGRGVPSQPTNRQPGPGGGRGTGKGAPGGAEPDPATVQKYNGTWYSGGGCEYTLSVSVSGSTLTASSSFKGQWTDNVQYQGTWNGSGFSGTYTGSFSSPGCISCKATSGARAGTFTFSIDSDGKELYTRSSEDENSPIWPGGRTFGGTSYKGPSAKLPCAR